MDDRHLKLTKPGTTHQKLHTMAGDCGNPETAPCRFSNFPDYSHERLTSPELSEERLRREIYQTLFYLDSGQLCGEADLEPDSGGPCQVSDPVNAKQRRQTSFKDYTQHYLK